MLLRTVRCARISSRFSSKWSYKHHLGEIPLVGSTIGNLLQNSAEKFPERPAVIAKQPGTTLTFPELLQRADKVAAAFGRLGLQKGDRVGIWAPNSAEWEIAFFACSRAGLIAAQLNPGYTSKEMEYCVNKVGVKCVVCPERTDKHDFCGVLRGIDGKIFDGGRSERVPSLEKVVVISEKSAPKGTFNFYEIEERVTQDELDSIRRNQDKISMDSGATIMFTSGSTGNPKAALISHFSIVNNSLMTSSRLQYYKKHYKILVQVPFFHTFGTTAGILASLHFGTTLVLPSQYYQPDENIKTLESEKCNVIYGTPTMYVDLINKQKRDKRTLVPEIAAVGGAPTNPKLIQDMYDVLGIKNAVNFYGMTEGTAISFQSLLTDDLNKVANTVGHVGNNVEVKIVDAGGNVVPCGTPGELYVRGYMTMLEYYGDKENTEKTILQDKWLRTGDKVVLSEEGYGKIIGRIKDMIIRGGENIYPKEIEDFLSGHPKIQECQVVGSPHERLGEEVCACVRVKPGESLTKNDVRDFCKGQISNYKIPSRLFVVEEFPKTSSGKIQKFKLVERIVNGVIRETA